MRSPASRRESRVDLPVDYADMVALPLPGRITRSGLNCAPAARGSAAAAGVVRQLAGLSQRPGPPVRQRRATAKGLRRNKIGRLRRVAGSHRVVPLRMEAMAADREGVDVFTGVFDAGGVLAGVKDTVDG